MGIGRPPIVRCGAGGQPLPASRTTAPQEGAPAMDGLGGRSVQNVSAFFLDTRARLAPREVAGNQLRMALKTILLLLSLGLLGNVTYAGHCLSDHDGVGVGCCGGTRRHLAVAMGIVFVGRVLAQMVWFWARNVTWNEVIFEAGFVIPVSLASLGYAAARRSDALAFATDLQGGASGCLAAALSARDAWAVALFAAGTALNVGAELQRHLWKRTPGNAGHLYTCGLFRWARHINYSGEILSFVGFGLLGPLWAQWVALVMGTAMAAFSVPELAHYLALRYPREWPRYVREVPARLVPGLW